VRRIGALGVVPDPDVLDDRRQPGLFEIGAAGQERDRLSVDGQDPRLEVLISAAVEAGEIIVTFLSKEEQRVQTALSQLLLGGGDS
jgi:hypothetical protein